MTVLVALPTSGTPTEPFLASLRDLRMPVDVTAFDRVTIVGNFIPGQRELAVRKALHANADVLFMFDDDMILPPDALIALVDALSANAQLAVAGALYYSRDGLRPMAADRWSPMDTTTAAIPAFDDALTYCDAVGFGCVAIRVSALRSMPPPYFSAQVFVEDTAAKVRICNEDYLFCAAVRHAGWLVALHAGVRCKHYDRVSCIAYPHEWESSTATNVERMIVMDGGHSYRIVPYDAGVPTVRERHLATQIDYITVD